METKKCSKCNQEKILNNENFATYSGKFRSECRPCSRQMCKDYKAKNKQKIKEYNLTYRAEHKAEARERSKKYYKEHIEVERERTRLTHKRLRETKPEFKIAQDHRNRVRKLINGVNKSKKSLELLGCDLDFFKKWMEYQFEPGMTWENKGQFWHVDHVTPCASFNLTDPKQQILCFQWSNCQPMKASDNIMKSDKILPDEISQHKEKVLKFVEDLDESMKSKYKLHFE